MDFQDVVRKRRMVRNYDPDRPVPPEIRERLLDNAVRAPSAGFSQGWAFLVLETADDRARFWRATTTDEAPPAVSATDPAAADRPATDPWLAGMRLAPLLIIALSHRAAYLERYAEPDKGWTDQDESRWPVPYWHIDTGFAALLMMLTAVDEQLGACFFGIPPEHLDDFRDAFGVPPAYTPIGALSVGYPAPDRRSPSLRRGRRPVAEVVHRGRWGTFA